MSYRLTFPFVQGVRIVRAYPYDHPIDGFPFTVGECHRGDSGLWRADLWNSWFKSRENWCARTIVARTLPDLRLDVREHLRTEGKWWQ